MKDVLTTKDLAEAIGVGQSSIRRWIDAGKIQTARTEGGHRRIPLAEAVRFIRASHSKVVRPELLGFAALSTPAGATDSGAEAERLYQALVEGDARTARGLIYSLYLTGSSLVELFDGPIKGAMHRVGELYLTDPKGILVEHRATDIVLQGLAQLRQMVGEVVAGPGVPVAVGGAPSGDVYLIPSAMAAMVLTEAGYTVINYGPDVPLPTLARGAAEMRPSLVWLSLTSVSAGEWIGGSIDRLMEEVAPGGTEVIIGGQALRSVRYTKHPKLHVLGSMGELRAFANAKRATGTQNPVARVKKD